VEVLTRLALSGMDHVVRDATARHRGVERGLRLPPGDPDDPRPVKFHPRAYL
jgi:hypothetical protein